ncbi:MAG: S8 family serine peptidase [Candidatus Omnitrophica bacterium]|nr:S8 family serine peptidase [Candidatus Omnitrophota bacterium]
MNRFNAYKEKQRMKKGGCAMKGIILFKKGMIAFCILSAFTLVPSGASGTEAADAVGGLFGNGDTTYFPSIYIFYRDHYYLEGGSVYVALRKLIFRRRYRNIASGERDVKLVPRESARGRSFPFGGTPDDEFFDLQWGLKRIDAPGAWRYSTGKDVVVAVLDTGIDYQHPDIRDNIWRNPDEVPGDGLDNDGNGYIDDVSGWDFAGSSLYRSLPDNDVMDRHGHGTHVSGIIAAKTDNSIGIAGVAPHARILPIKVLDDRGYGSYMSLVRGIRYAADMGARVINMSLAGRGRFSSLSALYKAVKYAVSKGCALIAAAGNSSRDVRRYFPANFEDVISVGATNNYHNRRAYFSNYGDTLDIAAPGTSILSLRADGTGRRQYRPRTGWEAGYRRLSGTSMAAPMLSGVAALLLSRYPDLDARDVRDIVNSSAVDLGVEGDDPYYGHGLVDAYEALKKAEKEGAGKGKKRVLPDQKEEAGDLPGGSYAGEVMARQKMTADMARGTADLAPIRQKGVISGRTCMIPLSDVRSVER